MCKLFILIVLLPIFPAIAQQHWSEKELEILHKFGLSENDHRGLILQYPHEEGNITQCKTVYNAKDALVVFLTGEYEILTDVTRLCITEDKPYANIPMDIHAVISAYLNEITTSE